SGTGHLLKSPFCVHPKTGFVCVPIDPQRIDEFDPTKVPRLGELMEQLSQASASAEGEASEAAASAQHLLPYKQTTLRPYIEFFDNFVSQVCAPRSSDARPANTKDGVRAHSTQAIPA
uniref:DNA primase small subunit n=1 Tax=Mesocestoides corti TaxID=53468 RepID=A0A5K3FX07_MESCO